MTKMRILSAMIILSAAVATPVFAQIGPGSRSGLEPGPGTTHYPRAHDRWNYRGSYAMMHRERRAIGRPQPVTTAPFINLDATEMAPAGH
jgi:hypothetical protein